MEDIDAGLPLSSSHLNRDLTDTRHFKKTEEDGIALLGTDQQDEDKEDLVIGLTPSGLLNAIACHGKIPRATARADRTPY